MVQGEYRQTALSDFLKGDKNEIKDISYITKYQQDLQRLAEDIVNKESEIQEFIGNTADPQKRNQEFKEKLDKLKAEKQQLIEYRDYLFGEGSLGYVEKMLFAMDTSLSGQYLALNYNQFIRQISMGKSVEELTQAELQSYNKEWEQYKKNRKDNLDEAFQLYKSMEKKINPSIQQVSDNIQEWQKYSQQFIDSFNSIPSISYDTRLEGESDEDYQNRDKKLENETQEQYTTRVNARAMKIQQLRDQEIAKWIDSMMSIPLDRNQFRTIQSQIQVLKKNKVQEIVRTFQIANNPELTHKIWSLVESSDLKDLDKLKNEIESLVKDNIQNQVDLQYAGRSMYSELDWGGFKRKLKEIGEDSEGYLTYGDLYKILQNYRQTQEDNKGEYKPEQYLQSLSDENNPISFDPGEDKQSEANNDFMNWYAMALISDEVRESKWDTPIEITPQYLQNQVQEQLDDLFLGEKLNPQEEERNEDNGLNKRVDKIIDNLLDDPLVQSLSKLENKAFSVNPVSGVIEAISKLSTNSNINIHEFLEQIYSQYQNGENAQSFQLTESQEKILSQFIQDLRMSQAFIHAASDNSDYTNPVGHNKAINQFISNHRDVFSADQDLPEISQDYSYFLLNEIASFIKEANNWIELSRINTSNKARKFTIAEGKYTKTVSEFYKSNRDSFKINQDTDLLEGIEDLGDTNNLLGVAKIEQLLHNNYLKAKARGVTIKQILDALLPKITNLNEVASQLTSRLDENLDYSKLTSYDKLSLVVRSFAISPKKFYSELLKFIQDNGNIAPLSIQEEVAMTVLAQQSDPELINSVLNYLQTELKIALPILENTSIVLGLGGAGKSAVVAKLGAADGENAWLCGPAETQINSLNNYLPKGVGKSKEELLNIVLGSERYAEFKNSFSMDQKGDWKSNGKFGNVVPGLDGNNTVKVKDSVVVNKIQNAPKLIVIDEATHFNTAELQIISKFAKLNGIQVLLLGDDHQNGSMQKKLMMNLDREVCLAWRTSKLFISLRDNNTQKAGNLTALVNMIDYLDKSFNVGNDQESASQLLDKIIPNFGFNYYNKESFRGEMITKELPQEIIDKLSGEIGFIGSSNSDNYKKLQQAGKNPILIDPISVQGQEFDYVIVDKEWDLKQDSSSQLYFFLRDLYTMISRSRNGTILIERGDLSKFHSIENELTGTTSMKSAIRVFREQRIPILQNIVESLVEEKQSSQLNRHRILVIVELILLKINLQMVLILLRNSQNQSQSR